MTPSRKIDRLLEIMAALRTPGTGCPWDLEQNFSTIAPYTVEEAYEVADAIERGDLEDLKDELGDLLLQVVFHARMAEEAGDFEFGDVVEAITAKLIRRHPHVFGDAAASDGPAVKARWDAIKAEEKQARARRRESDAPGSGSLLDDVPVALPALSRALKLQKRAATVGFDWDSVPAVLDKIREEIAECEAEIARDIPDDERLGGEIGDLLFAVANLARHCGVDPEAALGGTNAKFRRRFGFIESELRRAGRTPQEAGLDGMEALWREAKDAEG